MKMITLLDQNNNQIAINSENILTIFPNPLNDGVIIELINGSQIIIPHTSIEEVCAKINQETNIDKLGHMTSAICDRIQHLEDSMAAGLQYIGRSCH